MRIKTIWITNQPEGVGFDATSQYLEEATGKIIAVLRRYNAAIIGQHLIMAGDDDDFYCLLEDIRRCLTHGDDDESPVYAEFREDVGEEPLRHAIILR